MVFFTDLDHTLIWSHRYNLPEDKICVELLNGQQQSFMTGPTWRFLTGNPGISIVPVTTRTELQYRRLTCMDAIGVRSAIVCNGGKLLINGVEDSDWTQETLLMAEPEIPALRKAAEHLRNYMAGPDLHEPEPYMVYARCEDLGAVCESLRAVTEPDMVYAAHDRRKVYLFCRSVTKGSALRRFRQRFHVDYAVAAGDDPLDVPMLNEADYAMFPESLSGSVRHGRKHILRGEIFSDEICRELNTLISSQSDRP